MKKYKLSQLIKIKNGREYKHLSDGNIPLYGSGGIMTYVNDFLYDGESILLPRKGTLDNISYVNGKFWTVDTMYWSLVNADIVYPRYLYYYLSLLDLSSRDSGSTLPSMTFDAYYDLDIVVPDKDIQKMVLDIIVPLDEKIFNNNTINNNLVQSATTLYDFMFAKKSANGKLSKILIESPKSTIQVGDSEGVLGDYPFFTSGETINEWTSYLVDGINCFLSTGGNASIKVYYGKASYSTDTWCITDKGEYSAYLYFYLKSIIKSIDTSFFAGSGLKHLQKDALKDVDLYLPTIEELEDFNKIVCPILKKSSQLYIENKKLIKQRDFLLPLLMNGQATIEE